MIFFTKSMQYFSFICEDLSLKRFRCNPRLCLLSVLLDRNHYSRLAHI